VIFQDFPDPGIFKKKIQDFPGGVGTLLVAARRASGQNWSRVPVEVLPWYLNKEVRDVEL